MKPAYVPSGDPDEYHPPAVARHEEYISRGAKYPKRVSVAHYDGGVVEGWFTIADGFVQLCDVMGAPHSERRRFAIGDNEEKLAQALLRQRFSLPETDFGRPLRYPQGPTP
jgi:hypothetical protein